MTSGDYAQIMGRDLRRAFGPDGLKALHADYVAVRERAQRGPEKNLDPGTARQLPADEESVDPGGSQQGRSGGSPGLHPVAPGGRDRSVEGRGDLGAGSRVTPVGPQPQRTDGLGALDPEKVSQLLNDYYLNAYETDADGKAFAQQIGREILGVLTPENVDEAMSIAAVDFVNEDGERPPSIEDAKTQLKGVLKKLAPELFAPKVKPKYDHGSTQVNVEGPLRDQIVKAARNTIFTTERAGGGIETTPHITIRYGLGEGATATEVDRLVGQMPPIEARIGPVRAFPERDGVVPIYLSIEGDLAPLHDALADLDSEGFEQHESSHAAHHPGLRKTRTRRSDPGAGQSQEGDQGAHRHADPDLSDHGLEQERQHRRRRAWRHAGSCRARAGRIDAGSPRRHATRRGGSEHQFDHHRRFFERPRDGRERRRPLFARCRRGELCRGAATTGGATEPYRTARGLAGGASSARSIRWITTSEDRREHVDGVRSDLREAFAIRSVSLPARRRDA